MYLYSVYSLRWIQTSYYDVTMVKIINSNICLKHDILYRVNYNRYRLIKFEIFSSNEWEYYRLSFPINIFIVVVLLPNDFFYFSKINGFDWDPVILLSL